MNGSFNSPRAPEPVGAYPHALRAGDLLFLSGVGPRERGKKEIPGVELDEQGKIISYDIEVQCHSVFKNVKNILEAAHKLQAIGCFCIGVNQVDLKAATKNGVVVFNAPYSNTRSVAELVIGSAIMLIRKIPDFTRMRISTHRFRSTSGIY